MSTMPPKAGVIHGISGIATNVIQAPSRCYELGDLNGHGLLCMGLFSRFCVQAGGSPLKPRSGQTRSLARRVGTLSAFALRAGRQVFAHPTILSLRIRRHRARTLAERALHHHGVEPAAEFEADMGMGSDHLKAGSGMDPDRSGVGGVADHRDHLPVAARLAFADQPLHQLQAWRPNSPRPKGMTRCATSGSGLDFSRRWWERRICQS